MTELSQAIKRAIAERSSQRAVGDALASEGLEGDKDTVNRWANGQQRPWPEEVFAIERILGVPPGSLSQHDGYLPPSARSVRSVPDAIRMDRVLGEGIKEYLIATYDAMVKRSRTQRRDP